MGRWLIGWMVASLALQAATLGLLAAIWRGGVPVQVQNTVAVETGWGGLPIDDRRPIRVQVER